MITVCFVSVVLVNKTPTALVRPFCTRFKWVRVSDMSISRLRV